MSTHVRQNFHLGFFGNVMFASETLLENQTPGRKSDLEALLNVICVMHCGYHPVMKEFNKRKNKEIELMIFRLQNKVQIRDVISKHLPVNMKKSYEYVNSLSFERKPDYMLIKLLTSTNAATEKTSLNVKAGDLKPQLSDAFRI